MSEPKRYSIFDPLNSDARSEMIEEKNGDWLRADDPAVISALKDSEDLATIKHLVGAHSVDEIKQWKRSHEAMEKLEELLYIMNVELHAGFIAGKKFMQINQYLSAPSLIEAIEQVKE